MRRVCRRVVLLALVMLVVGPWAWIRLRPDPPDAVAIPPIALETVTHTIYVINWGYHTSIVVPQPAGFALGPSHDPEAAFVEFAWGDRSFYMESNYWPHRLFASVALPTESVGYLAGWSRAPARTDGMPGLWSRRVTADELRLLYTALEGTLRHAANGARLPAFRPAPGYRGRFYPAHGAYLFWNDCNRWTVEQLHAAGLAESGVGVILARQVPGRLRGFSRE
jgi:hypothetical protein